MTIFHNTIGQTVVSLPSATDDTVPLTVIVYLSADGQVATTEVRGNYPSEFGTVHNGAVARERDRLAEFGCTVLHIVSGERDLSTMSDSVWTR